MYPSLCKKCPYSELFWSGEILRISLYSVWMRENADQNNSKYGHFLRSASLMDQYFYTNPQGNMRLPYQNLSDTIITDFIWSYERHSDPWYTSKMEILVTLVKCFQVLPISAKRSILDIWHGSEYASVLWAGLIDV